MSSVRLLPGLFKTNPQKLAIGIWPWTEGLKSRLPLHYKKRHVEKYMKAPIAVHYRPDPRKYFQDEFGAIQNIPDNPIPMTHPPEADLGLWGGEGFIIGYKKKKDKHLKPAMPKMWKPRLYDRALYSEILDRWMEITVTKRTLDLIDDAFGFDFYILRTHEVDLKSKLGMRLKRDMLHALVKKSMYPNHPEKCEEIYDKYKEFIIPEDEIDWLGLSLTQAENKQAKVEETITENKQPLKEQYMEELIQKIKANDIEDLKEDPSEKSMFSNFKIFK